MARHLTVQLDSAGRVLIPAAIRQELQLGPGSEVVLTYDGFAIQFTTKAMARRKAQELAGKLLPANAKKGDPLKHERELQRLREAKL